MLKKLQHPFMNRLVVHIANNKIYYTNQRNQCQHYRNPIIIKKMEENDSNRRHNKETLLQGIKHAIFDIFVSMLKNRKIGRIKTIVLITIMFMQIFGTILMRSEYINWKDDIADESIYEIFELVRVTPSLISNNMTSSFWIAYGVSVVLTLVPLICVIYLIICYVNHKPIHEWMLEFLQHCFSLFFWILFNPVLETLLSALKCDSDEYLKIDKAISCYSGIHILLYCVSCLIIPCAFSIVLLISLLNQKTQPEPEDCMAHLENPMQFEMTLYRIFIFMLTPFENDFAAIFIIKYILMIITSILLIYQYIRFLPFFDEYVSIFVGFLIVIQIWILGVSCITFVISVTGHFIIVLVGIIPAFFAVQSIRMRRIENILLKPPDKTISELEAILQCHAIYSLINSKLSSDQEIRLIGLVHFHQKECNIKKCPLVRFNDLYDPRTEKFVDEKFPNNLHKNQVFLKHFTKMYFETAISNFSNFSGIRIVYAFFLFHAFNNVHASLSELLVAKKCKPTLMQTFEIYKFEQMVESHLLAEQEKNKAMYYNLTSVIDFELLFQELSDNIWRTCDSQSSFWIHLSHPRMIDFNALDKDNEKIFEYSETTNTIWEQLCAINDLYPPAINKYSAFLRDVRNNESKANDLLDKLTSEKKTINNFTKDNEVLFEEQTAIIHVSASKDTVGKILKISQSSHNVFGYSTNELLQNSINKIVPSIIARKHNELMEHHFKTGRSRIFNKERTLFGLHKEGYCFPLKLLVKPMSRLEDNFIHYVGLIIPISDEYEYIITDKYGAIDSISRSLSYRLNLHPKAIFKAAGVNVQLLAPDLINSYQEENKKAGKGMKYKEIGGEELTLVCPKGFKQLLADSSKFGRQKKVDNKASEGVAVLAKYNNTLNHHHSARKESEINSHTFFNLNEYKEFSVKIKVKCEIHDYNFGLSKTDVTLRLRVLRISGIKFRREEEKFSLEPFQNQPSNKSPVVEDLFSNPNKEINQAHVEKIEEEKKEHVKDEDDNKIDIDSNDFEEENVVKLKPQEDLLETPREPLESSRQLLDSGAITDRQKPSEIPGAIREVTEEDEKETPVSKPSEERKDIPFSQIENSSQKVNTKESLLRNSSLFPSIIEGEGVSPTHHKKSKMIDYTEKKLYSIRENFDMSKDEQQIRQHFLFAQLREKKTKEPILQPGEQKEETDVEEKKPDEELAEEAADDEPIKENEDDGEGSMGSTSTGATTRSFYSIRAAIDEKFLPKSIKNMNYITIFMFLLLLGLATGYFSSEFSLYSSINTNIKNIGYSEERKNSLIDINLRVKSLVLINKDNAETNEPISILDMDSSSKDKLQKESQNNLTSSAKSLKEAQTELSLKTSHFSSEKFEKINPSNVKLNYKATTTEMPSSYYYTIWQAMLEVVVTSLRISNLTIDKINDDSPAVYLISNNSLNSILSASMIITNIMSLITRKAKLISISLYRFSGTSSYL